ncbi:hypothetical protein PG996_011798 [Apiospora saccharicola]|uniref:Prion-inhibition and propagation HeLo domain-containing protein n=1 Tax=Apiospora saccharicola TaxID=335842 RepID=A0ABR1UID9_9PEZI
MEAAGVGMGAVSLLFQVFSGCVKGYQLFAEAKGLQQSYQYLHIRFKAEQYKLLDWANIVGLSEDDETLAFSPQGKATILEILDQQHRLLLRFGRLDNRLRPLAQPLVEEKAETDKDLSAGEKYQESATEGHETQFPQSNPLLRKALLHVRATAKYPARLRWAISDKKSVEELLDKLKLLNDSLHQLLSTQQLETLNDQQMRTNYEIIQLNNRIDILCELVKASTESTIAGSQQDDVRLADLARFKAMRTAIETDSLTSRLRSELSLRSSSLSEKPLKLPLSHLRMIESETYHGKQRAPAWYKVSPIEPWSKVWIEWTSNRAVQSEGSRTVKRFEALVRLLREEQYVAVFQTLRCLGYVERPSGSPSGGASEVQYGFVFERPPSSPSSVPVSLAELLTATTRVPSLTARIRLLRVLAESVEKLHAVDWLHKGLRSQNILFFHDDNDRLDLRRPFLSGFEYSRPDGAPYLSESPPPWRPRICIGGPREDGYGFGYKKHHDIYALGVVFLEIAYWKPVYSILGYDGDHIIRPGVASRTKDLLMSGVYGEMVESYLGDTVADIVRACLSGSVANVVVEAGASDVFINTQIQTQFHDLVVQSLQQLKI